VEARIKVSAAGLKGDQSPGEQPAGAALDTPPIARDSHKGSKPGSRGPAHRPVSNGNTRGGETACGFIRRKRWDTLARGECSEGSRNPRSAVGAKQSRPGSCGDQTAERVAKP
jgi:hypothetical protein